MSGKSCAKSSLVASLLLPNPLHFYCLRLPLLVSFYVANATKGWDHKVALDLSSRLSMDCSFQLWQEFTNTTMAIGLNYLECVVISPCGTPTITPTSSEPTTIGIKTLAASEQIKLEIGLIKPVQRERSSGFHCVVDPGLGLFVVFQSSPKSPIVVDIHSTEGDLMARIEVPA